MDCRSIELAMVAQGVLGMLAVVCGVVAQNPSIVRDATGNIAFQVPAGRSVMVSQGGGAASPMVTRAELSQSISTMQLQFDTFSRAVTAQLSTLELTQPPTSAPTVGPTTSPTAPPTVAPTSPPTPPPTLNCVDGLNGAGTACARWRPAVVGGIKDVAVHNTNVTITPNPFSVSATANGRGCGQTNLGSSMGVYLTGPWTKIRYTTTLTGRTSCYSMFGNDVYNYHEHLDNTELAGNYRASLNYLNQLGAEGGGLYEYDPSAGDIMNATNWQCPGRGWTCAFACSNTPHPWSSTTSNLRQINVTLRRRYTVYAGGVQQYADDAGPAVGVTCAATGITSWTISNIELLS